MNRKPAEGEPDASEKPQVANRGESVSAALEDDPELLAVMLDDTGQRGPLWTATPYWQGYSKRIVRDLSRSGLANVRTNQRILKASR